MTAPRDEQVQTIISRVRCILKGSHNIHGFHFGDLKLGRTQTHILFFIRKKESTSVKELAKFLEVTPGAVTQLVDSLIEKGLLQRKEDEKDRRILKITLTKQAEQKFQKFRKDYFKSVVPMFDKLSDSEMTKLCNYLNKVQVSQKTVQTE